MPKINIQNALQEKADRDGDLCACGAAAEEPWEPHCMICGSYWRDVDAGLFSDLAEPLAKCAHCSEAAITNLDREDLCRTHADLWVRNEGFATREFDNEEAI